ncbi:hypothetical protein BDV95DRAFT_192921 [Massariosphaeria phaeospora]|uniref:Uncharacterized protein n=1 Tax=Massariosphaeria phaeospora TaxID=100035 RepID=A0A7C8M6B9_9PLEO|nr:hypothetical protein BDV95DRAFT_192921 [Massariosphaeria phaeospora]
MSPPTLSAPRHKTNHSPAWLRYGVYCLLSLLSTTAYLVRAACSSLNIWWLPLSTFLVCWIFIQTVQRRTMNYLYAHELRRPPHALFDRSVLLVLFFWPALLTSIVENRERVFEPYPVAVQTLAIHFAFSFLFISELEFYRLYHTQMREKAGGEQIRPFREILEGHLVAVALAQVDPDFHESRDYLGAWLPPRTGWERRLPRTSDSFMEVILNNLHLLAILVYQATNGCLNLAVRSVLTPSLLGDEDLNFYNYVSGADVLFKSTSQWQLLLGWLLLRPVRLLSKLLFREFAMLVQSTVAPEQRSAGQHDLKSHNCGPDPDPDPESPNIYQPVDPSQNKTVFETTPSCWCISETGGREDFQSIRRSLSPGRHHDVAYHRKTYYRSFINPTPSSTE